METLKGELAEAKGSYGLLWNEARDKNSELKARVETLEGQLAKYVSVMRYQGERLPMHVNYEISADAIVKAVEDSEKYKRLWQETEKQLTKERERIKRLMRCLTDELTTSGGAS